MVERTLSTAADGIRSAIERGTEPGQSTRETEPPPDPKLVAENLTVGYDDGESPVIEGESMVVPDSSITALIGPNGSGKSTMLRGLAGQIGTNSGAVFLDGAEISTLDAKTLARKIGVLSQENVTPQSLTVEKLVEHGRYPHRGFLDSIDEADRRAIDRAIELAGIEHIRDREVGSLSGGQRQLVWIAMVLAQETDVLLLDEPTTYLDLHHKLAVMDLLETLRAESAITMVVVLHDIELAARMADHVAVLKDGSVVADGQPDAVLTESLLASVFDIESIVSRSPEGLQITPLRSISRPDST